MKRRKHAQQIVAELKVSAFTDGGELHPDLIDEMLDTVNEKTPEARPFLDQLFPFVKDLYKQTEEQYLNRFEEFLCSSFSEDELQKIARCIKDEAQCNYMISGLQMPRHLNTVRDMHKTALEDSMEDFHRKLQKIGKMPLSKIREKLKKGELDPSIRRALRKAEILSDGISN